MTHMLKAKSSAGWYNPWKVIFTESLKDKVSEHWWSHTEHPNGRWQSCGWWKQRKWTPGRASKEILLVLPLWFLVIMKEHFSSTTPFHCDVSASPEANGDGSNKPQTEKWILQGCFTNKTKKPASTTKKLLHSIFFTATECLTAAPPKTGSHYAVPAILELTM